MNDFALVQLRQKLYLFCMLFGIMLLQKNCEASFKKRKNVRQCVCPTEAIILCFCMPFWIFSFLHKSLEAVHQKCKNSELWDVYVSLANFKSTKQWAKLQIVNPKSKNGLTIGFLDKKFGAKLRRIIAYQPYQAIGVMANSGLAAPTMSRATFLRRSLPARFFKRGKM